MSDIKEAKRLLGEEGRPNRPDFNQLNNLSHVARLSRQEHISIQEAMEYIKHMEQASAATLLLLENMEEGEERCQYCGSTNIWHGYEATDKIEYKVCKDCGKMVEPPVDDDTDDLLEMSDHPDDLLERAHADAREGRLSRLDEPPAEEPERVGKGTPWDTGDARVNELLDQGCELGEALDQAAKERKKEEE